MTTEVGGGSPTVGGSTPATPSGARVRSRLPGIGRLSPPMVGEGLLSGGMVTSGSPSLGSRLVAATPTPTAGPASEPTASEAAALIMSMSVSFVKNSSLSPSLTLPAICAASCAPPVKPSSAICRGALFIASATSASLEVRSTTFLAANFAAAAAGPSSESKAPENIPTAKDTSPVSFK